MWNFTMLDTSSTINRRAHSHANVIPKASSIATKILCPVIRFRPLFLPAPSSHLPLLPTRLSFPPTSPSHPPLLPTHLSFPPTSPSHPRTQRTYIPPAPPAAPHLRPRYTPRLSPRHPRRHSPDTPPGTPQTHPSLPKVARNSSRASFADGLKTPEYQRSYFKT